MNRPITSFILGIASLILSPILLWVEVVAFMLAAMITYEPANSLWVKILSVVVVVAVGLLALSLPTITLVLARRSSAAPGPEAGKRSGFALTAAVLGILVIAGVLAFQLYLALWAAGVCSLEGC